MKYKKFKKIELPDRKWPQNEIKSAPIWCSVDLRDGNQALVNPMNLEQKIRFFNLLKDIGFKEIEIGFPSASEVEYRFCRYLIENDMIGDDITISVLTQAREHLIRKTAQAVKGAKNVIVHLYNSTSTLQREVVFEKSQEEIIDIALNGVDWVKKYFKESDTRVILEYSPESFTQTELDFAARICNEVVNRYDPRKDEKVIINLPSTVEVSTPNVYADQIEWMCRNLDQRENIILSVHTHNDRGTAVAASELALMAGADRIEGTLLGNGERTGNVDIITMALNMFTQGIDPKLSFEDIDSIIEIVESSIGIKTHPRHPYAGELVYTAFSGSHQDAIGKGMRKQKQNTLWRVPYLPIDPKDVGRNYESIIRINSQSGKGGAAYLLEEKFGFKLPKKMTIQVAKEIQKASEEKNGALSEEEIYAVFSKNFLNIKEPLFLRDLVVNIIDKEVEVSALIMLKEDTFYMKQRASGIIEAVSEMIKKCGIDFEIEEYFEHALEKGSDAKAVSYLGVNIDKKLFFGAAVADNITHSSINALFSAINVAFFQCGDRKSIKKDEVYS